MEKYLYLNSLYDCYGKLLTKKQQMYFEEYYFENLSLSEISENDQVSRSAVSKQLKIVEQKLYEFEEKLKLKQKKEQLYELLKNEIDDKLLEKIQEIT